MQAGFHNFPITSSFQRAVFSEKLLLKFYFQKQLQFEAEAEDVSCLKHASKAEAEIKQWFWHKLNKF